MKNGLPVILIWGKDYVARELARSLVGESVLVILKGRAEEWLDIGKGNIEFTKDVADIDFRIDYIFDFEDDEMAWSRTEVDEARLVVIKRNKGGDEVFNKLNKRKADWRMVCGFDVYGEGMELDENWLSAVFEAAVLNKDLILPKETGYLRALSVTDFVEAIKKACFVPGISGEKLLIFGQKVSVDEICKTLVSKAKMTKKNLLVREESILEIDDKLVEEYWDKISWEGGQNFEARVGKVLRYFFEKMDPIVRSKKKQKKAREGGARERFMEVEIEVETKPLINPALDRGGEQTIATEKQEEEINPSSILPLTGETKTEDKIKPLFNHPTRPGGQKNLVIDWENSELNENEKDDDSIDLSQFVIKPAIDKQDLRFKKEEVRTATELQEQELDVRSKIEDLRIATENIETQGQRQDVRSKIEDLRIATRKKRFNFNWGLNWKLMVAPFVVVAMVYVSLVVSFFGGVWQSARAIEKTKTLIEEKKTDELRKLTDRQLIKINNLKNRLRIVSFEGKVFSYKGWGEVLRVLEIVWKMEKEMSDFLTDWTRFGEGLFLDKEMDWQSEKKELKNRLLFLENSLGMIEARTEGDWSFLPGRFRSMVNDWTKEANKWKQLVSQVSDSMDIFYHLIAADGGRKDFLILMQNEMELRPTGGFIGSYGILSFEDGKFLNMEVGDVYDIDGQLKGHVEPPKPIKEILGEASWYLRDANWQADFNNTAKDIEWFFRKETGRNIDGIISINLAATKTLVEAVGEVWIADYNEKVTVENLYEQAQFHSEKGFFAGSRQKSMFLGKLSSQLVDEIKEAKDFKQLAIVRALLESLNKNEIQIFVKDKQIKTEIANMGWDGSMYMGGCATENCLADYLFIVEANLGVNKSNYFLRRNIDRLVDVSNRAVARVIKISYENTARNVSWPGGDYKNYMRVYLPKEVNIAEVSVYDTNDMNNKKILTSSELEITTKTDKKELAFLVTVPVTKKRTVEIRYSSQIDLNLYEEFSYLSYIQKQSGYGETPIVSLVSFPADWKPLQVEPVATMVNQKLLFDQVLERDLVSGVVMGK